MSLCRDVKYGKGPERGVTMLIVMVSWLRTNGVNPNRAAAKVMIFDRLGEKGTPWHFWEYESRSTGVPKKFICQTTRNLQ